MSFVLGKKAANGLLNKIALAPEREGVENFVRTITGEGDRCSWTLQCDFDEAKKKQSMLEQSFGNTYNGMRGLTHRELGMVEPCMSCHTYAELICDGHT